MQRTATLQQLAETLETVASTRSKLQKIATLAAYFHTLNDDDLRIACTFLRGAPFPAGDNRKLNVGWAALTEILRDLSGHGDARLHDAYLRHGDLGHVAEELLATAHPSRPAPRAPLSLRRIADAFGVIAGASGAGSRGRKTTILRELLADASSLEAKYLVKIMTSDMRVGLKEGLLEEAIAAAFGSDGHAAGDGASARPRRREAVEKVRRANMLISHIGEVAVMARHGRLDEAHLQLFRPFHFMLAETIFAPADAFAPVRDVDDGDGGDLLVEDKYDGVRAQVHRADGRVAIFSRTLDDITGSFPELLADLERLTDRYILDGEILAWRGDAPLSFSLLQQRLRRAQPGRLLEAVPVVMFAFDLLHHDGEELLERPLRERRDRLEALQFGSFVRPSLATVARSPDALALRFREARDRGNEGLVVKRLGSRYAPGRRGRQWMKMKEELATLDVVVVAAEHGHGRRAPVLSDVTFAVRDGDRLRTIGKAYSGLTDREIAELTKWFQAHTVRDLGRVKMVEPQIVLEVAFDAVTPSDRHDSGFALRFPRIKRLRPDKSADDVNTLRDVEEIYGRQIVRLDAPIAQREKVAERSGRR